MQMRLLALLRLIAVAGQACADRIGLHKSRRVAGVRIVTVGAISRRARMLYFCFLDLLGLVGVAGDAEIFRRGLRQDDFAVFGRRVARVAGFLRERGMEEPRHQLGRCRLMRIVTGQAIRRAEGLVLMRLLQRGVFHVVAIQAKRRNRLGQVESNCRWSARRRSYA